MRRILYIPILFVVISSNLGFLHPSAKAPEQSPLPVLATHESTPQPNSQPIAPNPETKNEAPKVTPLPPVKDGESPIALSANGSGTIEMDIVAPKFIGYKKNSTFGVHLETKDGQSELKLEVKKSPHAHTPAIRLDGDLYTLLQFHFHAPSEHQLNGKKYELEAHFVHANKAKELAVIGLMFAIGNHNEAIQEVIDQVKNKDNPQKIMVLESLVPLNDTRVFRYYGSLTTPPYTKNVKWQVMKTTAEVSKKQLREMRKLSMLNGARDIQPLRKRVVVLDSTQNN